MSEQFYVINSRGEEEPFSFRKVYRSARRVGASKILARKIAEDIEKEVYNGITTTKIFRKVENKLQRIKPQAALRFNLKQGMKKLGPTGFPFEKYIGEIFRENGFKVQLNQHIPGSCSSYEIDFIAKKENLLYIGECKYRNQPGGRVHLESALSNYARFLDIEKGKFFNKIFKKNKIRSLLITNTKFTSKTIKYSNCVGVELLGWNYPKKGGLEYLIDSQGLYPITILPSLRSYLIDALVSEKIMLVKDLLRVDIDKLVKRTRVPMKRLKPIIKEAEILLVD